MTSEEDRTSSEEEYNDRVAVSWCAVDSTHCRFSYLQDDERFATLTALLDTAPMLCTCIRTLSFVQSHFFIVGGHLRRNDLGMIMSRPNYSLVLMLGYTIRCIIKL